MSILDTHALVWYVGKSHKLSLKARKHIAQEINKGRKLLVSSISIWEIYLLSRKDKIELNMPPDTWLENVEQLSFLEFVAVNNKIAARSVMLPAPLHKDPADRIIVATAREYGATLITSDQNLRKYPHVQSLW